MRILVLGAESFGARSTACLVETASRRILIDPGVALAPRRFGLPPHPRERAAALAIRSAIEAAAATATDIVVTHYHGDHIPLARPDPAQIPLARFSLQKGVRFWCKGPDGLSRTSLSRRNDLIRAWGDAAALPAEERHDPCICCSPPVAHGAAREPGGLVLMVCIRDGEERFAYASDTQCVNGDAVEWIRARRPGVVLSSGPSLHRAGASGTEAVRAAVQVQRLLADTGTLILDHHLLRSLEGYEWLRAFARTTGKRVLSAAEYAGRSPLLLEAMRDRLYAEDEKNSAVRP
ncbi:MAG: MBL fold metallo-hydrolase [Methanomicrobiales archaeon]|nr:MBL fold metallo-hydrolase [Methanomicrobiales archaeon]